MERIAPSPPPPALLHTLCHSVSACPAPVPRVSPHPTSGRSVIDKRPFVLDEHDNLIASLAHPRPQATTGRVLWCCRRVAPPSLRPHRHQCQRAPSDEVALCAEKKNQNSCGRGSAPASPQFRNGRAPLQDSPTQINSRQLARGQR